MAEIIDIVTRYQAETDQYKKEVDSIIAQQKEFIKNQTAIQTGDKKTASALTLAANSRKKLLEEEKATLKQLEAGLKTAFNIPQIRVFNEQIAQSKANISLLKGEASAVGQVTSGLKEQFLQLGAGILAAFSVRAIINFATDSVHAFQEAELSAKKLETAITNIGEEGETAFQKLIDQSKELQGISIFSDEDIQRAQTQLSQFGLMSTEIEKLIPQILDLASAQGIDLGQATDIVIQGINGVTRGLKPLGLEFKNTGDKAENLAIISEKLNRFQGQTAAVLDTSAGRAQNLGNQFDELKERIGGLIESSGILRNFTNAFQAFIDSFQTADERTAAVLNKTLKTQAEGLQSEINAAIQKGLTFEQAAEAQAKRISDAQKLRQQERIEAAKAGNTEELNRLETLRKALVIEKQALDLLVKQNSEKEKATKLGLTEEEKTKREADALQAKNKALEDEKKLRNDLLNIEKQTQSEINRLRVETAPNIEQRVATQKEIDAKLTQAITEDLRTRAQIELDINQKKNDLLVLQNLKAFQEIAKFQSGLNFAEDERNLTEFINERTSLILLSNKSIIQQEKELTALQEFELQTRLQNARDFTGDKIEQEKLIAEAQKAINAFILEQDKKLGADRLKAAIELSDELIRSRELAAGSGQAGIELQKELLLEKFLRDNADAQQIEDITTQQDKIKALRLKFANDIAELEAESAQASVQAFQDAFGQISQLADRLFSDIAQFQSNQIAAQISELERLNEAQQTAADAELDRINQLHDDRLISQKDFQAQNAKIEQQRVATEKKIQAEIVALKKKQAERDKAQAIFNITLSTAQAVIAALASVPPNVPLSIAVGAIGAAELALAIATPIPAFESGTPFKKDSGMAIVGEKGQELVNLPRGSQVLPNKQTLQHRNIINAMFDNNLEKHIHQFYVEPALRKELISQTKNYYTYSELFEPSQIAPKLIAQKEKHEVEKQKAFAQNIVNSFVTNKNTFVKTDAIDEYGMNRALAKDRKNDKAFADYLAEKIGEHFKEDNRFK